MGTRHASRAIALQTLYELDFNHFQADQVETVLARHVSEADPEKCDAAFVAALVRDVLAHRDEIDAVIAKAAPEWPIDKINILDRNVLRIGICELVWGKRDEVPLKVAIDEAIELAKEFSGESAGRFVNGVLGGIYEELNAAPDATQGES